MASRLNKFGIDVREAAKKTAQWLKDRGGSASSKEFWHEAGKNLGHVDAVRAQRWVGGPGAYFADRDGKVTLTLRGRRLLDPTAKDELEERMAAEIAAIEACTMRNVKHPRR